MKKIAILLLFLGLTSFALHKYYVSVTEVYINPKNHTLDIIIRTFPDDMENVLSDTYHIKADLQQKQTLNHLLLYFKKKFTLTINNKKVDYQFIKTGMQDDFYTVLLQAELPEKTETIKIKNSILQEMFSEQKNIIHFFKGEQKTSFILTKSEPEAVFTIQ